MFAVWMLSLGYSVFPLRSGEKRPDERWLYEHEYRAEHGVCNGRGCERCRGGSIGSWKPLQTKLMWERDRGGWASDCNVGLATDPSFGIQSTRNSGRTFLAVRSP